MSKHVHITFLDAQLWAAQVGHAWPIWALQLSPNGSTVASSPPFVVVLSFGILPCYLQDKG